MNDYDLNVCNIIIIFLKVGRRNEISFFKNQAVNKVS
jgi:hypothetical protein